MKIKRAIIRDGELSRFEIGDRWIIIDKEKFPIIFNQLNECYKNKEDWYEPSIVFIGGLYGKNSSYGISSCIPTILKIVNQGIHYHAYTTGQYESLQKDPEFKELLNHPFFHLHPTVNPEDLSREISKYDFGIWWVDFDKDIIRKEFFETATSNKITNYMEAGLKTILNKDNMKFTYESYKDYCIGITDKDLNNLKDVLNAK